MVRVVPGDFDDAPEGRRLLEEFLQAVLLKRAGQCGYLFEENVEIRVREHEGEEEHYRQDDISRFFDEVQKYVGGEVLRLVQSTNEYYGKIRLRRVQDRKAADFWVHFTMGEGKFRSFTMIHGDTEEC